MQWTLPNRSLGALLSPAIDVSKCEHIVLTHDRAFEVNIHCGCAADA